MRFQTLMTAEFVQQKRTTQKLMLMDFKSKIKDNLDTNFRSFEEPINELTMNTMVLYFQILQCTWTWITEHLAGNNDTAVGLLAASAN